MAETKRSPIKPLLFSAAAALIVLVLAVWPAEFGFDPAFGEIGAGGAERLAERGGHPAGQGAGGTHRDLLAEHRAHRRLETVERAGHAQARMRLGEFAEAGAHFLRLAAEIEQPLQPSQHLPLQPG